MLVLSDSLVPVENVVFLKSVIFFSVWLCLKRKANAKNKNVSCKKLVSSFLLTDWCNNCSVSLSNYYLLWLVLLTWLSNLFVCMFLLSWRCWHSAHFYCLVSVNQWPVYCTQLRVLIKGGKQLILIWSAGAHYLRPLMCTYVSLAKILGSRCSY